VHIKVLRLSQEMSEIDLHCHQKFIKAFKMSNNKTKIDMHHGFMKSIIRNQV